MLARENLGGRHEQRLAARVGGGGQRVGGHDGLARSHVAQKQVVRRGGGGQRRQDVVAGRLLLARELVGQRRGERGQVGAVRHVAHGLPPFRARAPLLHEHEFQKQQLLVHQAPTRLGRLVHAAGEVDGGKRRPAAHEAVLRAQLERQRIVQARHVDQAVAHEAAHPRARELLGGGMHGYDHAGGLAVSPVDRLDERVRHALEPVVELQLPRHGHAHAGLQLVHEPWLAKRRDHERARAVHERDLHERQLRLGTLELDLVHGALDGALLADDRRGHRLAPRQVDVAPREVRHQVAHRAHAQRLERAGPRRAHQTDAPDGFVERERGCQSVRCVAIQPT